MHYVGLCLWTVGLGAFVWWGQSFNKRNYNLMALRSKFFALSAVLLIVAIGALATKGLNKGLDFTGGTIVEAGLYEVKTVPEVNEALKGYPGLGSVAVQVGTGLVEDHAPEEGKPAQYQRLVLRLTLEGGAPLEPSQTKEVVEHLRGKFGDLKELRTASIGPTISGELTNNAIKAVVLALVLQLVYIFFRFGNQIRYGLAADMALVHDVVIMIGFYSLFGREIDSPFVAALLTVVGYSVMDSVVIFDRIRENLNDWWAEHGEDQEVPYEEVVNDSVNQTMTRSINTTLTTLVTLLAIYYFGGATLQNFAFALLIGILSGAYSSICVASPLLVAINQKHPAKPAAAASWMDLDEVVPEDYMNADPSSFGAQAKVVHTPEEVAEMEAEYEAAAGGEAPSAPRSKGRKRKRGKRD